MNLKRALGWGLVIWLVGYFAGTIIIFSAWRDYIHYIFWGLVPIYTLIIAWVYFRKTEAKATALEGLKLGILWLVMSLVLDAIFIVFLITRDFAGYFGAWGLWVGYVEMVILVVVMGAMIAKRRVGPGASSGEGSAFVPPSQTPSGAE